MEGDLVCVVASILNYRRTAEAPVWYKAHILQGHFPAAGGGGGIEPVHTAHTVVGRVR